MGRDHDSFGGLPLPLRVEAIEGALKRLADYEGIRWRVIELEKIIYKARLARATNKKGMKKP